MCFGLRSSFGKLCYIVISDTFSIQTRILVDVGFSKSSKEIMRWGFPNLD